ncbi:MAG TPA: YCF48-related protein [Bryobacteraceae bacterium]|nr:YCF48-related protein [Bryobacteraceae bacterium]
MTSLAKIISIGLCAAFCCAASTVYVAASYGLYKSTDSGTSWSLVDIPLNNALLKGPIIGYSIALDPHDPNKIYMIGLAKANAFFSSQDGGQTWTAHPFLGIGIGGSSKVKVDFSSQVIYINAEPAKGGGDLLFKSTDGGATWNQITIPLQPGMSPAPYPNGDSVGFFEVDKATAGTVYVEDDLDQFLKSTDYGNTWTLVAKHITVNGTRVAQTSAEDLEQDPLHPNTWYAGTNHSEAQNGTCPFSADVLCGMFKSTDGAVTFTPLTIPTDYARSVAIGSPYGTVYAAGNVTGLGASILKTTDGGNTWTPIANGLFSPLGGRLWADTTSSLVFSNDPLSNHDFNVSTDGGATFTPSVIPQGPAGCVPGNCQRQEVQDVAIVPTLTPMITSVVNAASLQPGIAANTWVTIFGSSLAPKNDDWTNSIVNGALPTNVDGVKVTIGGKPAYIYYLTPGQLNVLAPADLSSGSVDVIVTTDIGTSAPFNTTAAAAAPAFFEWPGNQVVATRQDYSLAVKAGTFAGANTVPAKPGDVLVLWATGFGATSPAYPAGVATPGDTTYATASLPAITINNTPVVVFGAALAPGAAGLYQIAIQVPNNINSGDYPIQAGIGSTQSPTGVILSVQSAAKQ